MAGRLAPPGPDKQPQQGGVRVSFAEKGRPGPAWHSALVSSGERSQTHQVQERAGGGTPPTRGLGPPESAQTQPHPRDSQRTRGGCGDAMRGVHACILRSGPLVPEGGEHVSVEIVGVGWGRETRPEPGFAPRVGLDGRGGAASGGAARWSREGRGAVRRAWPSHPGHGRPADPGRGSAGAGPHRGGLRAPRPRCPGWRGREPGTQARGAAAGSARRRGASGAAVTHLQARPSSVGLPEAAGTPGRTRCARHQGRPAAGSASSRRARGGTPCPPPAWGQGREATQHPARERAVPAAPGDTTPVPPETRGRTSALCLSIWNTNWAEAGSTPCDTERSCFRGRGSL